MSTTTNSNIYESTFAPSDKTDAILVVDEKKLHVNKALLSHYSDFFSVLFNADFAEKSMSEIPIGDVNFEEFATLLSIIQDKPITPTETTNAMKLLKLADRFLIPKKHLESFICKIQMDRFEKLKLGDRNQMEMVVNNAVEMFENEKDFQTMYYWTLNYSDTTRNKMIQRFYYLCEHSPRFKKFFQK